MIVKRFTRLWLELAANLAVLLGRKRRALDIYRQIVALNPNDLKARATIGNLLAQLGRVDAAIAEFRQLVALAADDADAWFNLGYLLESGDDLIEAERAFRRAVELRPKHDRAWYGLGLVLIRTARLREAVEALKQNTRLQPFSPYGWYQLGMTYHHLGESGDAWRTYEHLLKFEPRYAATLKRDMEQQRSRATAAAPQHPSITPGEEVASTT
jgi:tetratricopeptide (TPR) repeat protein